MSLELKNENIDTTKLEELVGTSFCLIYDKIKYKDAIDFVKRTENIKKIRQLESSSYLRDICALSNGNLATAIYEGVKVYDFKFNLIKSKKIYHPWRLATDYRNKIYIADRESISMVDLNLENIKSHKTDYSTYPKSLYFENNSLYCCNYTSSEVYVFDSNLNLLKTHRLSYQPFHIRSLNQTLCITSMGGLLFYDKNTLQLKKKLEKVLNYTFSVIGSLFYGYNQNEDAFSCYDEDGCIVFKKVGTQLKKFRFSNWETIVPFNSKYLMQVQPSGELIEF